MSTMPTQMTVAEYCTAMQRQEITVNRTYQRSDQVWPDSAKSFLIETILLEYPMPKIYLNSKTDLKTKRTSKEIVDGQQRSQAIFDFFENRYRLARTIDTEEVRGLVYEELPEEFKEKFLRYSISIDLFLGYEPEDVIEIFRRMNSYTVPLNPEEQRHAIFQGPFKWFIYRRARKYESLLTRIGVFNERHFVRMQDLKLLTEVCHAIEKGIATTNKKMLHQIYKEHDREWPDEPSYSQKLEHAFNCANHLVGIDKTNLARTHVFYSLLLGFIQTRFGLPDFELTGKAVVAKDIDFGKLSAEVLRLSDALDMDEDDVKSAAVRAFWRASKERTNVKDQRRTRVEVFVEGIRRSAVRA